ncbi:hypothetical protein [Rhodococcus aetherivorans]|uniref:hypothetical protein n=1 Tax=Rhodococcus aetherivorans TaxID=191292 RepID=UPI001E50CE11|nr:hypothetical protein [Rhodococcus aetherivorans]UGQ39896.1 hypothetical protein LRQ66_17090 [Rhodococcus aetherivorans]
MSRQTLSPDVRPSAPPRQRRVLVNRDELNQLPTIKGRDAAVRFINNTLGVPMSPTRMRTAIEGRELPVYKISGANYLAERDLYDWIMILAKASRSGGGDAA